MKFFAGHAMHNLVSWHLKNHFVFHTFHTNENQRLNNQKKMQNNKGVSKDNLQRVQES